MTLGTIWMVAGLVTAALEMLAPGVFLLWIGLAAFGTGAAAELLGWGLTAQFALFVILVAILIAAARHTLRRPAPDRVNAPGAHLIGQTCRALAFQNGEGRVSLADGAWPARITGPASAGATNPEAGEPLRVVGLEGTTLLVTTQT